CVDDAGEATLGGCVVRHHGVEAVEADVQTLVEGEQSGDGLIDSAASEFLIVAGEANLTTPPCSTAVVVETHLYDVGSGAERPTGIDHVGVHPDVVVGVGGYSLAEVQGPSTEPAPLSDDRSFGRLVGQRERGRDGEGCVLHVEHGVLV